MNSQPKQLNSPFSTGSGGANFETRVQSLFTVIMLTGGVAPCPPSWPIKRIKLQGRYAGFNTDDCILFKVDPDTKQEAKLLAQIKHTLSITKSDNTFSEVIGAAWRDYSDTKLFNRDRDIFALVTGPLNATDIENARFVLEWARHSENSAEFISKIDKTKFSSDLKRDKLDAFRVNLNNAKGELVSDGELWGFLKKFYLLGYDLDVRSGADIALILSLINKSSSADPQKLWLQILDEIQNANQDAGTITLETLSSEICAAFAEREFQPIPQEFFKVSQVDLAREVVRSQYASEIAVSMLLGSWDESVENDKRAGEKLFDAPYAEWIAKLRQIVVQPDSPLIQKNRKWKLANRFEAWNAFGPRIFDEHLERFKEIAVSVLREADPKFQLPKEEHFSARLHGKIPLHSEVLRNGLADSLALAGSLAKALSSSSLHKAEATATLCVREILTDASWDVWASLNDLLPLLAEASPSEFLDAVESLSSERGAETLRLIFALEGSGVGGWNYTSGLLWGLETLAWNADHLARTTLILGKLAKNDPGGSWANRPINSLSTIFLPWLPQTVASVEKRVSAIEALLKEVPEVGWQLLLTLLPNSHQVTSGSRKPKWREYIAKERIDNLSGGSYRVPSEEYWKQVRAYSSLAVQLAKRDLAKLGQLAGKLDELPDPAFTEIVDHLSSKQVVEVSEVSRLSIWETLSNFVTKHRKFSDAKWALPASIIDRIDAASKLIQPQSPNLAYRRLFGSHEFELYEEKGNYQEQRRKVEELRTKAVCEIIRTIGIEGIVSFSASVEMPTEVGLALGRDGSLEIDRFFLPSKLTTKERATRDLTDGYVWSRFHVLGWGWVDGLHPEFWTNEQKAAFLVCLPFTKETWRRASDYLGNDESLYWKEVDARPYQLKDELEEAVEKLLQHGRPRAAIACLNWMLYEKVDVSVDQASRALLAAPTSNESQRSVDHHATSELIKWLQTHPAANLETLGQIEWVYLRMLDHHFGNAPVTLERKLADEPAFFCEVIRTVFRSEKEELQPIEITEPQKELAGHIFQLLFHWSTLPGMQSNGIFDSEALKKWLSHVRESCGESGHLEIALDQIGKVFAHAPEDPDGLWIHKGVAEILNEEGAEVMRSAFTVELFNMRGVFWGTKGQGEKDLANSYRQKADAVEKEGFVRLAASLRALADSYDRDAEREASRDSVED